MIQDSERQSGLGQHVVWFDPFEACEVKSDGVFGRAILHDEAVYPQPDVFMPERFLGDVTAVDSKGTAFGYGRRQVVVFCAYRLLGSTEIFNQDMSREESRGTQSFSFNSHDAACV
jgi:hypothetical protein